MPFGKCGAKGRRRGEVGAIRIRSLLVRIRARCGGSFNRSLEDGRNFCRQTARSRQRRLSLSENPRADAARAALRRLEAGSASTEGGQNHLKSSPTPKTASPEQAAAEAEKAAKGKVRTYVVQSGETLASISKKFYQTPSRWKDILDANQNQLSNPDELKVGQTIIVP